MLGRLVETQRRDILIRQRQLEAVAEGFERGRPGGGDVAGVFAVEDAQGIGFEAALGVFAVVAGIVLAYETSWPVGFYVSSIAFAEYAIARLAGARIGVTT